MYNIYMEYELIKSKRKTITILVRDGRVQVRAPKKVSENRIEDFVVSKEAWISKQVQKQLANKNAKDSFKLSADSNVLFLGKEIPLAQVLPEGTLFDSSPSHDRLMQELKFFYRQKAHSVVHKKIEYWSEIMGFVPAKVGITGARTRWGSCNARGNLNFSWYLIMATEGQIDYVVIHELAHLKEMNHSRKFWAIVEKHMPDYKEKRTGLKELNRRLMTENWR